MDILAKKKAVPKSSKTAVKEEPLDSDARAADVKKPGPTKGRKLTKRQPSSSDSDSDFGVKPSKSVAAKVCILPHVSAKGVQESGVSYSGRKIVMELKPPVQHPFSLLDGGEMGKKGKEVRQKYSSQIVGLISSAWTTALPVTRRCVLC